MEATTGNTYASAVRTNLLDPAPKLPREVIPPATSPDKSALCESSPPPPENRDDPAPEMQPNPNPQKDESVPLSSLSTHSKLTGAEYILSKYNIGDIGLEEDMEERRDLLPFLKKGDIVFLWKGYDIWKLAIFDEVIEDGRYAFITKVDP